MTRSAAIQMFRLKERACKASEYKGGGSNLILTCTNRQEQITDQLHSNFWSWDCAKITFHAMQACQILSWIAQRNQNRLLLRTWCRASDCKGYQPHNPWPIAAIWNDTPQRGLHCCHLKSPASSMHHSIKKATYQSNESWDDTKCSCRRHTSHQYTAADATFHQNAARDVTFCHKADADGKPFITMQLQWR